MNKCAICLENDANKKGSHLIPAFLTKRIDSEPNEKNRDKGIFFAHGRQFSSSHVGRSVSPEKLAEIYDDFDPEKLKDLSNPNIVDDLFCPECEKRLGFVESAYADSVNNANTIDGITAFTFWLSILFRSHFIISFSFTLGTKHFKQTRTLLKQLLYLEGSGQSPKTINDIGYILLRCPQCSLDTDTFLFLHPNLQRPYSLMIDEWILFFFLKTSYLNSEQFSFLGFESHINQTSLNFGKNPEKTVSITREDLKTARSHIKEIAVNLTVKHRNKIIDATWRYFTKGRSAVAPSEVRAAIWKEMSSDQKKLGDKYTFEDTFVSIKTVYDQILNRALGH